MLITWFASPRAMNGNGISNSLWLIRMVGYAFRPHQLACDFSTVHEQHPRRLTWSLCHHLPCILVYSDDLVQHKEHIWEILKQLWQNSLFTKANKCKWHKDSVEFLGYILMTEGLMMAKDKVKIICKCPKSWKVKDVQSFLSFANFYHHFIYNYSDITVPLTHLTCKGTPWVFSDDCYKSFEYLKISFTTALILVYWEPGWPLVMETNTLDYVLAVIVIN